MLMNSIRILPLILLTASFITARPPAHVRVRVWDSTAEVRYLVVPMRPAGTEGWSAERLAQLVTRDSMIGTGFPLDPASLATGAVA